MDSWRHTIYYHGQTKKHSNRVTTSLLLCVCSPSFGFLFVLFCCACSPLKFIWLLQLVWWYSVLHVNLWWTSWVVVELYGVLAPEEAAQQAHTSEAADQTIDSDVAVRYATIGLLVQAIVSFPASAALTVCNRFFGITNLYHYSAILYGLGVLAIGFVNEYYQTVLIMCVLGLAVPPIFSSSYILVEVYAAEADLLEEDSDDEEDADYDESQAGTPHEHTPRFSATSRELTPRQGPISQTPTNDNSPMLEGHVRSRRPSDLQLPPRGAPSNSPSPSPPSAASRSRRARRASMVSPSEGEESEFTTATLEEKRGTITALFNITMICSQLGIGLTSGLLIDWIGNITVGKNRHSHRVNTPFSLPCVSHSCGSLRFLLLLFFVDRVLSLRLPPCCI